MKLRELNLLSKRSALMDLPPGKLLINTINAHSFNTAVNDRLFEEALMKGDVLLPDGTSVVWACGWLGLENRPLRRITGYDLYIDEMTRLNTISSVKGVKKTVMFVGSSEDVLQRITRNARRDFPSLDIVTLSPPYKKEFSDEDNELLVNQINEVDPSLLWIGMTAPKQEKWLYSNWSKLNIHCHAGTIGAVFDFYAETKQRAPKWMQHHGLEWFYRLAIEPRRMWRRYILGNAIFMWHVLNEKFETQ